MSLPMNDQGLPLPDHEYVHVNCAVCGIGFDIYRWQFEEDIAFEGDGAEWQCTSCWKLYNPEIEELFWDGGWTI